MEIERQRLASLLAACALFGCFSYPLYPLSASYVNDRTDSQEMVSASAGILLAWGSGAMVGPALRAQCMHYLGTKGLFAFIALAAGGLTLAAVYVWFKDQGIDRRERKPFVLQQQTSHLASLLHPHAPGP